MTSGNYSTLFTTTNCERIVDTCISPIIYGFYLTVEFATGVYENEIIQFVGINRILMRVVETSRYSTSHRVTSARGYSNAINDLMI